MQDGTDFPASRGGSAKPLRVMHVVTGLTTGGAERMLATLVTAGIPGIEQQVVSLLPGGSFADEIGRAGVAVSDLGMSRTRPNPLGLARLASRIRRWKPHIVEGWLYHGELAATAALALSGRRKSTALLWTLQNSHFDLENYRLQLKLVLRAATRLSSRPDVVVSNSEAGLAAHRELGYRPRRTLVIPPGVDLDRFRPDEGARASVRRELGLPDDAPLVLHVARVDPMKDHANARAALGSLPGVYMAAVGAGTADLPDAPRLLRLGERSDVARLFAAADLNLSSSAYGEGLSNALAEGMAAGLPAVSTDVGDAARLISDTGRIVPPRDAAALATAARDLLAQSAPEREARRAAARARIAEHFSLARMLQTFDRLFREQASRR